MFHYRVAAPRLDTEYAISALRDAVAGIASERVRVSPVSEVWRQRAAAAAPPATPP